MPDDLVFAARCDAEKYLQNAVVEGWWMLPALYADDFDGFDGMYI